MEWHWTKKWNPLPQKRTTHTRPALDDERSQVFCQAVRKRFNDDTDAITVAKDVVNQLGCDLRCGIRFWRRPLEAITDQQAKKKAGTNSVSFIQEDDVL